MNVHLAGSENPLEKRIRELEIWREKVEYHMNEIPKISKKLDQMNDSISNIQKRNAVKDGVKIYQKSSSQEWSDLVFKSIGAIAAFASIAWVTVKLLGL